MNTKPTRPDSYFSLATFLYVGVLAAILVAIALVGVNAETTQRAGAWVLILVLMIAFAVIAGRGITGSWRGILIDHRYRMSLSRLQLVAWTVLILSALFTAVLTNVSAGAEALAAAMLESALDITIPPALWVLLGISTASAVASPMVLESRGGHADPADTTAKLKKNEAKTEAEWADLLVGDEEGRRSDTVDLGKLQMFFFTFILLIGYGAAIMAQFQGEAVIASLPAVEDGMNALLGISHTGYLATKAGPKPSDTKAP